MKPAGLKSIPGVGYEIVPLNERQWTEADTHELLATYKANMHHFSSYTTRVRDVWDIISNDLKQKGINKSGGECDKKFRNLQSAFKRIYYDKERTEKSKYQWGLYAELLDIMTSGPVMRRSKPVCPVPVANNSNCESVYQLEMGEVSDEMDDNLKLQRITMDTFDISEPKLNETENLLANDTIDTMTLLDTTDYEVKTQVESSSAIPNTAKTYRNSSKRKNDHQQTNANKVKRTHLNEPMPMIENSVSNKNGLVMESNLALNIDSGELLIEDEIEEPIAYEDNDEPEAPSWFQSFLINYETHTKMFQEKLNKIQETQELQNTRLQHLATKVQKIEKSINDLKK